MKRKFTLSTVNSAYLVLVTIALIGLHVVLFGLSLGDDSVSNLIKSAANLVAIWLPSCLLSWFVWRISKRREKGGNWTLNIILTLTLLGMVIPSLDKNIMLAKHRLMNAEERPVKKKRKVRSRGTNVAPPQTLKQAMGELSIPKGDQAIGALGKLRDLVSPGLKKIETPQSDVEAEIFRIMSDFTEEFQKMSDEWEASHKAIKSEGIPEYSRLKKEENFRQQKHGLQRYVKASEAYIKVVNNMVSIMERRYKALGPDHNAVREAIKGLKRGHAEQQPYVELMTEHVERGGGLILVLEFLERYPGEWSYQKGEIVIDSKTASKDYQLLASAVARSEARIDALLKARLQLSATR